MKRYIKSAVAGIYDPSHSSAGDDVRFEIAEDPRTRPETLAELAVWDTNPCVLEKVAKNPNTPTEVLLNLIRGGNSHTDSWVAAAAVKNLEARGYLP